MAEIKLCLYLAQYTENQIKYLNMKRKILKPLAEKCMTISL